MKRTRRLLAGSRGRVLQLLRRKKRTVNDLAAEMGLTDNAIRAHLSSLERDGFVQQVGSRPSARRPEAEYGLTSDASFLFPKAYGPLLTYFLESMRERVSQEEMRQTFREIGQRLATSLSPRHAAPVGERVDAALSGLAGMGGLAEADCEPGRITIRGYDCPIAAAVQGHPDACILAQTLLSDLTGLPVEEHCDRSEDIPRCRFVIATES